MKMQKAPAATGTFRRRLGLFDATAIVAGSMIGSGIFIVSADIARSVGSPGLLLMVWLVTGLLTVMAAMTYGELSSMMPHAGGQYVFLKEAYGPLVGFLYGWSAFLVIQGGTIAAVAMGFAKFTGVVFPWVSESRIWFQLGPLKVTTVHFTAILSIVALTLFNSGGILPGKVIQNTFTTTKVVTLLLFIIIGLLMARNPAAIALNRDTFWKAGQAHALLPSLSGFALVVAFTASMVGSLFSSDAWNNVTFASDEVKNPRRVLPLSLILGTLIVTVTYLFVNIAYLQALPLKGDPNGADAIARGIAFAREGRVATAAMEGILGSRAALIMAILVMISTFGCNNGIILSSARVYYAMAADRLFFRITGRLNRKGVPAAALWIQCGWTSLLCLSGSYSELLDYVIFTVLLFYLLTIFAVFRFRKLRPDAERLYKAVGYPLVPVVYMAAIAFIMVVLLMVKPVYTGRGLLLVLTGLPVYILWHRRQPAA
jgi:basic amino acid/polyamine antiporter, APA family